MALPNLPDYRGSVGGTTVTNRYNDYQNWLEAPGGSAFVWFYGDLTGTPGVVNVAGDQPFNFNQTTMPPGGSFVDPATGQPTTTFWLLLALLGILAAVTWST